MTVDREKWGIIAGAVEAGTQLLKNKNLLYIIYLK
jgi:hypothetical protein